MFELTEDKLTWDIVGQWTAKDTDLEYSTIVRYQPMVEICTMIGSSSHPDGKAYRIRTMYFLKGFHLFIAILPCSAEPKDFQSKSMIDLSKCSLMTEPIVARKPARFLSTSERALYMGEKFFFSDPPNSRILIDQPPHRPAFILRFPETQHSYDWEEASKFSAALKRRIHQHGNKRHFNEKALT